jgi:hypothetical protein
MVVVLSNDDFNDAVSEIIERDYYPSNDGYDDRTIHGTSLTHFHQTTTNETTAQLEKLLQDKEKASLLKQSFIYKSDNNELKKTAELKNALFFPVSTTTITGSSEIPGAKVNTSMSFSSMPPPPNRKPLSFTWKQNDDDDDGGSNSVTTLDTIKTVRKRTHGSSDHFINPRATRFPNTTIPYRRRKTPTTTSSRCDRHRRKRTENCYQNDDATEPHWEGSTNNVFTDNDDDNNSSSNCTDLDATTIDTYSIRSELQKAKLVAKRTKESMYRSASSTMYNEAANGSATDSVSIWSNPLVFQLPNESPRDRVAAVVIQQQQQQQKCTSTKGDYRRRRRHQNRMDPIQGQRPAQRSIKSLRSALKETYRKQSNNNNNHSLSYNMK